MKFRGGVCTIERYQGKEGREMTRSGWQRTWVRILTTLLTAAVMVMIFGFSTENAEKSDHRSGVFAGRLVRLLYPDFDRMDPEQQEEAFFESQVIVRKCAHVTEYTVLGFLIRLCLESWFGHKTKRRRTLSLGAFGAGIVYACTDEAHQLSIDGRAGLWTDVLVDAGGVLAGIMIAALLIRMAERMKEKRNRGEEDGILQEQ